MKRHVALEPFSRDHYSGLTLAKALVTGEPLAAERCRAEWEKELKDHFEQEERLLGGLVPSELSEQLAGEHREIADLISLLPETGQGLARSLTIIFDGKSACCFLGLNPIALRINWLLSLLKQPSSRRADGS